jgi:hypothetical protein
MRQPSHSICTAPGWLASQLAAAAAAMTVENRIRSFLNMI